MIEDQHPYSTQYHLTETKPFNGKTEKFTRGDKMQTLKGWPFELLTGKTGFDGEGVDPGRPFSLGGGSGGGGFPG